MYDGLNRQEVEYRIQNGMVNNEKIKHTRSIKSIVMSNLLTLFNFINIGLLVLVFTTGYLENGLFAIIIIINTCIAIGGESMYAYYPYKETPQFWDTNNELTTSERSGVYSWYYAVYPAVVPTNATELHTATWHLNRYDG